MKKAIPKTDLLKQLYSKADKIIAEYGYRFGQELRWKDDKKKEEYDDVLRQIALLTFDEEEEDDL